MSFTIYAIQNKVNKKIYIGRSSNAFARLQNHMNSLKSGRHQIADMQDDYNKYGDVFNYFILETAVDYSDRMKEYQYIKKYNSHIREYGYNYNDHLAKRFIFGAPKVEIELKGEAELYSPDNPQKRKYITEILERLNKCNDLTLFDLVLQLLDKG